MSNRMDNKNKSTSTLFKITGYTLLAQQALFFVAFYILGTSISWPNSLGFPAEVVFPLITEKSTEAFSGYYFYLLASVFLIPLALLVKSSLSDDNDPILNTLLSVAMGFGIISGAMKILGIVRWLFAMPMLADVYLDPNSTEAMRQAAVINFDLLNTYAGKLGEHIGVQLLTTFFIATLGLAILRTSKISSWFGWLAFPVALMALPHEDLWSVDLGPFLMITGTSIALWIIGLGVAFLRSANSPAVIAPSLATS